VSPSTHQATGVHVLPFHGKAAWQQSENRCQLSAKGSHPPGYGAALRFSQPLSDLPPLAAVLPFSDRWRSWGCALQGVVPFTKPRQLVTAGMPSWRCSCRLRCLSPRLRLRQARVPVPRKNCAPRLSSSSGPSSAWKSTWLPSHS